MLKKTIIISTVVALLAVTAIAKGPHSNRGHDGNRGHDNATYQDSNRGNHSYRIDISDIPLSELTETQRDGLLFMIEEEKVARDVYAYLYDVWGSRVFRNIRRAEQRHMDAIENLIDRYSLDVPSTLDNRGEFDNEELQSLYNTLIEKGKVSLIDALEVGVMVEETDITDLEDILTIGVPEDFEITYQNLLKGSYNHLNAFNQQLARE